MSSKLTYTERFKRAVKKGRRTEKPVDDLTPSLGAAQEAVLDAFALFAEADEEIRKLKAR